MVLTLNESASRFSETLLVSISIFAYMMKCWRRIFSDFDCTVPFNKRFANTALASVRASGCMEAYLKRMRDCVWGGGDKSGSDGVRGWMTGGGVWTCRGPEMTAVIRQAGWLFGHIRANRN